MNDPETLRLTARFAAVADEELSAAYDMGVQDSMLRVAQLERILRDLIDTLRFEDASPFDPWIRRSALGIMADEAGVRLAGVSSVVSSAVAAHDEVNPPADDSACPLCNTEWPASQHDRWPACDRFQEAPSE